MIDIDTFYRQMGAPQSLSADEQLVLQGQVRVMCTPEAMTAVFEAMSTGEDKLDALFNVCRQHSGLLPFTTRSGHIALRISSLVPDDETSTVLQRLRAVMEHFDIERPGLSN